jgi:DMSO/TMAO reductase YedYZ molybdopterin-dependent catalytic subunit
MSQTIGKAELQRRTRRAFLTAGAAGIAGALGLTWVFTRDPIGELPWPLRAVHEANAKLWRGIYSPNRLGEDPPAPPAGTPARVNGDIGLEEAADLAGWRLEVTTAGASSAQAALTMNELRKMPQSQTTTIFKCIEGWSEPIAYGGIKFSDFLATSGMGTRDGKPWAPGMSTEKLYSYAGLETPDAQYYVSLDMESLLHQKTLLATEINGAPLTDDHGAPLRLIVPVKYGIKSLKRIGKIVFSDTRPKDYWAEQGYDWYAGL